jgi:uncharacterized membrane protein YkoI
MSKLASIPLWLAATALLTATAVSAYGDDIDSKQAHDLVKQGRILPLAEIVRSVSGKVPGEVLEVELELEHGAYIYELKILRTDGRVQEVEVDATNGKIVDIEDDD